MIETAPLLYFWLGMAMTAAGAALVGSAAAKMRAKAVRVRADNRR